MAVLEGRFLKGFRMTLGGGFLRSGVCGRGGVKEGVGIG